MLKIFFSPTLFELVPPLPASAILPESHGAGVASQHMQDGNHTLCNPPKPRAAETAQDETRQLLCARTLIKEAISQPENAPQLSMAGFTLDCIYAATCYQGGGGEADVWRTVDNDVLPWWTFPHGGHVGLCL